MDEEYKNDIIELEKEEFLRRLEQVNKLAL